jgi:oligopeptide/dipeptide ABC transporter ATP-binding protein
VSFSIARGEILGLAGESGSGKSLTALSLMRLLPTQARASQGSITFLDRELTKLSDAEMLAIRGRDMAMIFQEPLTSLNPLLRCGFQIGEVLEAHRGLSRRQARLEAIRHMQAVGIASAEARVDDYPHQLSGGMRQRVMIAMAMACVPKLLVADEPTTALDVSVQAQILALIRQLRDRNAMGVLIITHDLGVLAALADRILVMYAGEIVESAPAAALFAEPRHPYTDLLIQSAPRMRRKIGRLKQIAGSPPVDGDSIAGCRFHPRCPMAIDACRREPQKLQSVAPQRMSRCSRHAAMAGGAN